MITSTANQKIRRIAVWQSKARERRRDGIYLAEGVKMFREAPREAVREVYLTENLQKKLMEDPEMRERLQELPCETVSEEVFARMSDTQTPQGILTVLRRPEYALEALLKEKNPLFLVLEDLQDPGNLGTILRTGEGAGVTGVILSEGTVDIFNPKVIRATMGSVYRVPFLCVPDPGQAIGELRRAGVRVYAAHLEGERYYDSFSFQGGTAFLIGNEGSGLRRETARLADAYVKIPMEGQVESLNAAVAASLLMYEVHRQRKQKGGERR